MSPSEILHRVYVVDTQLGVYAFVAKDIEGQIEFKRPGVPCMEHRLLAGHTEWHDAEQFMILGRYESDDADAGDFSSRPAPKIFRTGCEWGKDVDIEAVRLKVAEVAARMLSA